MDHWKKSIGFPSEEKCPYSVNYADDQVIIVQVADDLESILKNGHGM